jgi:A/G-specific adenine glycosylase
MPEAMEAILQEMEEGRLSKAALPLLNWYDRCARDLPWRKNISPYRTWVSEIMLQQTRVSAVIPYYQRFLEACPDIKALAELPEDRLHKLWEGLGYYSRVRNMQKAARIVMEQHGGQLPGTFDQLVKLPGIGEYTAGAISSIAFGQPEPAVDGNVLRVISRLLNSRADIMDSTVRKNCRQIVKNMIPPERPGDFTQAMMELGAILCLPDGKPECQKCPLKEFCAARMAGTQEQLPVKAAAKARKIQQRTIVVLRSEELVWLQKRPSKGLLAGLWEPINLEGWLKEGEILDKLKIGGDVLCSLRPLAPSKHIFSHVEWHMHAYRLELSQPLELPGGQWLDAGKLQQAIPGAFAAYRLFIEE